MKPFNPTDWKEVPDNETFQAKQGQLWLRFSGETTVYAVQGEAEGIIGTGLEIQAKVSPGAMIRLERHGPFRAFVYSPEPVLFVSDDPSFFNADMMPRLSGSMLDVLRSTREAQLLRKQQLDAMSADFARWRAMRLEMAAASEPPVSQGDVADAASSPDTGSADP